MIIRSSHLRSLPSTLHHYLLYQPPIRSLHARTSTSSLPIPQPTPFVPDPSTFLTLIGRNLSQHASKIPSWTSLFSLTSTQLRELGVEPARTRRYLLWWRDRFAKGLYGVGGDLKFVQEGKGVVKVVEVPIAKEASTSPTAVPVSANSAVTGGLQRTRKIVINEPPGNAPETPSPGDMKPVEGMKVVGAKTIVGPYVEPVKGTKGSMATIKIQEGMWEFRRGVKVDGGERRKVQVRRKRLLQERKTKRT